MPETLAESRNRLVLAQRNYDVNLASIDAILKREQGIMSNKDPQVVALCSGGLDSTVMVAYAIEVLGATVHPLFIKRGARAERYEEAAFDFLMEFFKEKYNDKLGHPFKAKASIPDAEMKRYFPESFRKTVGHPMRNSTMQNIAVGYATMLEGKYGIESRTIFSGSVEDDCTVPELGLLSLRAQTLSTCIQTGDWRWNVTSPFIDPDVYVHPYGETRDKTMSKRELILYSRDLKIPLEKTRTCFSRYAIADGTCPACKARQMAFERAGITDPIQYRVKK